VSDVNKGASEQNGRQEAGTVEQGGDEPRVTARAEETERREEQLLAELHETRAELERAYSALVNDQKDFRSRLEREQQRRLEADRARLAIELFEVGDEIERALAAAAGDEGPLAQGVRLIREGLMKRLAGFGIERLELAGKPFDPNLAEAVDLVAVSDRDLDDRVVDEVIAGYRLGERVLRPARVRVARFVEPAQPATGDGPQEPEPGWPRG
jgi:molecular chaperone GrpE